MTDKLVKAVAAEIGHHFSSADRAYGEHINCAREAVLAIEAAGFAVVPVEPTSEMIEAGAVSNWGADCDVMRIASRTWPAMLSARPKLLGADA